MNNFTLTSFDDFGASVFLAVPATLSFFTLIPDPLSTLSDPEMMDPAPVASTGDLPFLRLFPLPGTLLHARILLAQRTPRARTQPPHLHRLPAISASASRSPRPSRGYQATCRGQKLPRPAQLARSLLALRLRRRVVQAWGVRPPRLRTPLSPPLPATRTRTRTPPPHARPIRPTPTSIPSWPPREAPVQDLRITQAT